jgi:hypothetical protein
LTSSVVDQLKRELNSTWENMLIPEYHRSIFLECISGVSAQQSAHIIVKELTDL